MDNNNPIISGKDVCDRVKMIWASFTAIALTFAIFLMLATVNHENKHCRIEVAPLQITYRSTRYTSDPLTDYIAPKNVSSLVVTNNIYDFCGCDKTTSEYQQQLNAEVPQVWCRDYHASALGFGVVLIIAMVLIAFFWFLIFVFSSWNCLACSCCFS